MASKSRFNLHKTPATWIVIGIILVVAVAAFLYVLYGKPAGAPQINETTPTETQQPAAQDAKKPAGSYVVYSERAFEQDPATNRKVLFFHANWCPQCRAIEKDIIEQGVPAGMTIFKVDYDSAGSLKSKYGVTLQTTIVEVAANGDLIKKYVAYNKPSLTAILDELGR